MKKLFIAAFIFVSTFTTNTFAEVKMGIILGFTSPIESLTPAMAASAELAGVRDSIGPVNPKMIPILIACPSAITFVPKLETSINAAINSFFIIFLFLIVNNL